MNKLYPYIKELLAPKSSNVFIDFTRKSKRGKEKTKKKIQKNSNLPKFCYCGE